MRPESTSACSCGPAPAGSQDHEEAYGALAAALSDNDRGLLGTSSDFFTGTVVSQRTTNDRRGRQVLETTFGVHRVWAGDVGETYSVLQPQTSCLLRFDNSSTYVVYAVDGSTGVCSGTHRVVLATDDGVGLPTLLAVALGLSAAVAAVLVRRRRRATRARHA